MLYNLILDNLASCLAIFKIVSEVSSRLFSLAAGVVISVSSTIYFLLKNGLHFNIKFIYEHNWIIIYLILINILSFITFGIDKYKAKKNYYRISLFTLFTISFLGGSLGGIIAMYIFHHKTNKNYFVIGLPMILIMQIVVFYYIGCLI